MERARRRIGHDHAPVVTAFIKSGEHGCEIGVGYDGWECEPPANAEDGG